MSGAVFPVILPEICLVLLAILILVLDLVWQDRYRRRLGAITSIGILVIIGISLFLVPPGSEPRLIWGGMLRMDQSSYVFLLIFLAGAGLTALFAMETDGLCQSGEFYVMLLISTVGMILMAASGDLIMLYLAIETTSIPQYVMAGFLTRDQKSVESGLKYLLFGGFTSAIMLFGFSLLYGFSGTTQIYELAAKLQTGQVPLPAVVMSAMLVLAGFGFKISAAPFHFWAPDVYEGAPTPVAGFLSTASKAAGFAVLLRFMLAVFPNLGFLSTALISALAVASMFIGNFLALTQKNIKRLLAYSSIAQAGYILIGVAANVQMQSSGTSTAFGGSAAIYYLITYLVTNLAAFGIVTVVGQSIKSDEISDYAGLSRRSPSLALAMLVAMLSLGGIPPFAGFVAKVLVFGAAVQANMVWLAVIGIINSVIALYYYLVILKVIWQGRSEDEGQALVISFPWKLGLVITTLGIVLLGTLVAPGLAWSNLAAAALLIH